ncbi:ABC transporter permease [Confluentibacter sediminis]|uniref:ABC transporter permease n=1 Tax=Confluentibacter sediminis TaxID=2219045 RepID=UPI0013A6DB3A|nr:ABC transporter permease [Confluentibacter sediminis]
MNIIYHLKLVYRNFINQRPYSFLNLLGLSIGLCITYVSLLYVTEHTGYDTYHKNAGNIYRLLSQTPLDGSNLNPNIAPKAIEILKEQLPEIKESFCYIQSPIGVKSDTKEKKNNGVYFGSNNLYASPEIVKVLSFQLLQGDFSSFKTDPKTIIVSERFALEFFNEVLVVGKTVVIDDTETYTIGAVYKNFPKKSTIKPEMVIPVSNLQGYQNNMKSSDYFAREQFDNYLLLENNVDVKKLAKKTEAIIKKMFPDYNDKIIYEFQKLTDVHLHSDHVINNFTSVPFQYVIFYGLIGLLALIVSLMNYMLLYTAILKKRLKELMIRSVNGLSSVGLIKMFLIEAVIISIVSSIIALVFVDVLILEFNKISVGQVSLDLSNNYKFIIYIIALIIFISTLVGVWLYICINKYNAVAIFNGEVSNKKIGLKNAAIALQLVMVAVMLIFSAGFYKQLYDMIHADKGYHIENLLVIREAEFNTAILREELLKNPVIESVATGNTIPSYVSTHYTISKSYDAKEKFKAEAYTIDENFIPMYQLEMVLGDNFTNRSDSQDVILNETAVKVLGLKKPIGERIDHGIIAGVVKDFNSNSLKEAVEPMIFSNVKKYSKVSGSLTIKYVEGNKEKAEKFVLSVLDKQSPNHNVDLNVLDKMVDGQYYFEERLQTVVFTITGITIFITILGLIGMSLFKTQQRTKEIGIRKVNGATICEIILMLNRDFIKWVFITFVVACPIAYYTMTKWLENFAYKTTLSWWVFAMAGLFTLVITLLTVSWQTYRAASRNPAESLRDE